MTPQTPAKRLLAAIQRLPQDMPISGMWAPPAHTASHKAHWIGWLSEYDEPGYYRRRVPHEPRSMAYIYGHIHCAPMLLWLAEASGVDLRLIWEADAQLHEQVKAAIPATSPAAGRHFRELIGWPLVEAALTQRSLLAA